MAGANDGLKPEHIERAQLTQEGMAQFELLHAPVKLPSEVNGAEAELVVCRTCKQDFPCERMGIMLIVQGMAMLQSMIPSGNMGAILGRFGGGGR